MKNTESSLQKEVVDSACYRMDESMRMIGNCFEKLSENEVWRRPNPSSNSIGNLMLHLCGNIRQYAISSLGGREDIRERKKEFEARSGYGKEALLKMLGETVGEAKAAIRDADMASLVKVREVQGFSLSGIGIITHVVEHLSYHTGQIAFWTKIMKDTDLGFYRGVDLNKKNR